VLLKTEIFPVLGLIVATTGLALVSPAARYTKLGAVKAEYRSILTRAGHLTGRVDGYDTVPTIEMFQQIGRGVDPRFSTEKQLLSAVNPAQRGLDLNGPRRMP
jgi:hypothetical protein